MAGVSQNPEIPVVLACQDNVFVAVPQSLLIKESSVFRAELSPKWQNSDSSPVDYTRMRRKRKSETANTETTAKKTATKDTATTETAATETAANDTAATDTAATDTAATDMAATVATPVTNSQRSEMNGNQPKVIQIKEYKSEAVKFVIEWINGYTVLLSTCKDIQILADMIMFADYYDIQRPMKSLATQMEATQMYFENVIPTMGVVVKLERLASAKDISTKLELRCKDLAISHLKSANILSKFVRDNCDNMDLVIRLLQNCDGLLKEPHPTVKFPESPLVFIPQKVKCTVHTRVYSSRNNHYYCGKCYVTLA